MSEGAMTQACATTDKRARLRMTDKTDYIKRSDAIEYACKAHISGCVKDRIKKWINDVPSADVVERNIIDDIRLAEYANGLADGVNSEEHKQGQMIQEYIDAWNERKDLFEHWLRHVVNPNELNYKDIVVGLIEEVINPYLEQECPAMSLLHADEMKIIDSDAYQGVTVYIIPRSYAVGSPSDYIWTHNYYGSCCGCDTLLALQTGWNVTDRTVWGIMSIALHILERMKPLE